MTKDEWVNLIRHRLDRLAADNAHHEFEKLCMMFARRRIASNIVPATGPVSAGGDQGRDFETFRTYIVPRTAGTTYERLVSEQMISFACSTERNHLSAKIRADVRKILNPGEDRAGPLPTTIFFFATADIPVGMRHRLQAWARTEHQVELHVMDGNALAHQLAECDLLIEAAIHLHLPRELIDSASLLAKLNETREMLVAVNQDYELLASVSAEGPALSLRPKREDIGGGQLAFTPEFEFPDTPEGRNAEMLLDEHFRTGAPVRIGSQFVSNFGVPESVAAVLGLDRARIAAVELGPLGAGPIIPCDATIECPQGEASSISGVGLSILHAGSDQTTLSNLSELEPLRFLVMIDWPTKQLSVSASENNGVNVKRQLEAARFQRAMNQGGILSFVQIATGMPLVSGLIPPGVWFAPDDLVFTVLEKLLAVQQRTRCLFSAPASFAANDIRALFELAELVVQGELKMEEFSITLPLSIEGVRNVVNALASKPSQEFHLCGTKHKEVSLWGTEIVMGRAVISAKEAYIADEDRKVLESAIESGSSDDTYQVVVRVPPGQFARLRYEKWLPELEQRAFFSREHPWNALSQE